MKNFIASVVVSLASLAFASPEIRNVTAKQRFPWNGKVDITYEVIGNVAEGLSPNKMTMLLLTAKNREVGTSYEAAADALSGDTGIAEGLHHVVWDLNEQGIEFKSDDVVFTVAYSIARYCVIDLSAGVSALSYPVIYMSAPPRGGFNTDEYKTTKLVLRLIEPGSFKMGGLYDVSLTQPFYCGIFEVTQKQYSLIRGNNPSKFTGDKYPVEQVSYDMIRGAGNGATWPSSSDVDSSSFMGRLRARTGLEFDLPTEAQWEYACRAGTMTTYRYGDSENENYMWYNSNCTQTHYVGTKSPNPWGLYDMHGNVSEWCLDWFESNLTNGVVNPNGPIVGAYRVMRGGCWLSNASNCTSSIRAYSISSFDFYIIGFRLVRTLSD